MRIKLAELSKYKEILTHSFWNDENRWVAFDNHDIVEINSIATFKDYNEAATFCNDRHKQWISPRIRAISFVLRCLNGSLPKGDTDYEQIKILLKRYPLEKVNNKYFLLRLIEGDYVPMN